MVTKSLLYKKIYEAEQSLPAIDCNKIAQILVEINRIHPVLKYELKSFPITFQNVMDGTRKDIIFHYKDRLPIRGDPILKNGKMVSTIKGYRESDKIIKEDIVAFFTKNNELRIYQIGRRYIGEDINFK